MTWCCADLGNGLCRGFHAIPKLKHRKNLLLVNTVQEMRSRLPKGGLPPYSPPLMDILIGILTVVEVLVCLLMILIVLMQRPRQEGLGASFGDGAMTQLVGAQTTNVLQKGTVYLAVLLFVLTISLAVLTTKRQAGNAGTKVFDAPPPPPPPVPAAPAAPSVTPAAESKPAAPVKTPAAVPAMKEPAESKPAPASTPAVTPAPKPAEAPKTAPPVPAPSSTPPAAATVKPAAPAPAAPAAPAKP